MKVSNVSSRCILDFLGLKLKVIDSPNKSLVGLEGLVIGETMKTFIVLTNRGRKIIPKDVVRLRFELKNGETVEIDGRKLLKRPEDRLWGCCF